MMAFDATRNALLMVVGSVGDVSSSASQLWQWDGSSWTNIGIAPLVDHPPLLLGLGPSNLLMADLGSAVPHNYKWDGDAWLTFGGASPTGRFGAAIGFDGSRQQAVIFGGLSKSGSTLNDSWTWSGTGWIKAP
jgi:hypothetical protein